VNIIRQPTKSTCGCMAAVQSPWGQAWAEAGPVCGAQRRWGSICDTIW